MRASKTKRSRKKRAKRRNRAKEAAARERQRIAAASAHLRPTRRRRLVRIDSRGVSLTIPFDTGAEVAYDPDDPVGSVERARAASQGLARPSCRSCSPSVHRVMTSKMVKHVLAPERVQALCLPVGSRPLSAQIQPAPDGGGHLVLWTVGPADGPVARRRVVLVQTGHEVGTAILDACDYVGTIQWLRTRRTADGRVVHQPIVEHVWLERETAAVLN